MGDGWLGMGHTPESAAERVGQLRDLCAAAGRDPGAVEVTVMGTLNGADDVAAWEAAGVDRLIVTPWTRSKEAIDGIRALAETVGLQQA